MIIYFPFKDQFAIYNKNLNNFSFFCLKVGEKMQGTRFYTDYCFNPFPDSLFLSNIDWEDRGVEFLQIFCT